MAEFTERIELLRLGRLFTGLNDEDLEAVNGLLLEKRFRKGSVVFQQGDVGDAMYIIEKTPGCWVLGAVLGVGYGLTITVASVAALNIAGGSLNDPIFGLLRGAVLFALLGVVGTLISERTLPQVQALLSP